MVWDAEAVAGSHIKQLDIASKTKSVGGEAANVYMKSNDIDIFAR